jgi:hypothetical protein
MTDLVLWGGPVFAPNTAPGQYPNGDIGDVVFLRDTKIITISQGIGGFGSSHFSALGAQYKANGGGSTLAGLLAAHGVSRQDFENIGCAGFSAWHGLLSHLLATDGWDIRCSVMLDACFSAVDPGTWLKPGFVSFGERAARGEALCCYTSSNGGGAQGQYPSSTGAECSGANFNASAAGAGVEVTAAPLYEGIPQPETALQAGELYWYDFQGKVRHDQQAHDILRPTLQAFLPRGLAGPLGDGGDEGGGGEDGGGGPPGYVKGAIVVAGASVLGYAGWRWWKSRR